MARRTADGYQVVELESFGGLDLRRDPQDASPIRAIDMLNVELENDGRVRSRAGTTKLVSQSTSSTWGDLVTFVDTTPQLITMNASTGQLRAYDASSGSLVTTFTPAGTLNPPLLRAATMIGIPTDDAVMYLNVNGATHLVKYDGATFSDTAVAGGAWHSAVQYPDNRLVLANSGVASTNSRVVFSAPNNPESFDLANDYVDLLPGDGEQIVGLANFREFLFAFKQSKFFRFYGNSVDDQGGTVFNYQTVYHNLSCPADHIAGMCVSGREGVYFLAKDGIYLTDGGYPRKISGALDPLFWGADNAGYFTAESSIAKPSVTTYSGLRYVDGRLYFTLYGSSVFIYDPQRDAWLYWQIAASHSPTIRAITPVTLWSGTRERPYFLWTAGSGGTFESVISYLDPAVTGDQGHSISSGFVSYYQTNFLDLGTAGTEKVVREVELEGATASSNAVSVGVHVSNARASDATGSLTTVTMPPRVAGATTWPTYKVGQGRARITARGRNFSLKVGISPATTSWVLHRAMLHLRGQRAAGIKSA